jgi:acetyltransferase
MFGLGGVFVEVLRDVVFRMAPIARDDAQDMMRQVRGAKLLHAIRGLPPVDARAVEDVLLRVSQLLIDFPGIVELDVNPLLVSDAGVVAADARVILGDVRDA